MSNLNKPKVLCILGPTASGKSGLAEWIAEQVPAELVNVDSAQVYRHLNIGSAKPSKETLAKLPYHLIDIRESFETYSASEFVHDAKEAIADIHSRQKLPILVGGTMLYFKALFEGLAELPEADDKVRQQLLLEVNEKGLEVLHQELASFDPKAAARIKPTDSQRIQRALEVYRLTGQPISYWHEQQQLEKNKQDDTFNFIKIALMPTDRNLLHQRIEKRLNQMINEGFIQEVRELSQRSDFVRESSAMRSVGYRQLLKHVLDWEDQNESFMKSLFATRQLAKRQFTWLRKIPQLVQFDPFSQHFKDELIEFLRESNIVPKK